MLKDYGKTKIDVIDLGDIRTRIDGTYNVKIEAMKEPIKLNSGETIDKQVYFTVPRKEGQDCSTPRIHFISDLATLLLADMIRANKCSIGRF